MLGCLMLGPGTVPRLGAVRDGVEEVSSAILIELDAGRRPVHYRRSELTRGNDERPRLGQPLTNPGTRRSE